MSRFATSTGSRAVPDIFTALVGVAALVMLLGCLYMVFHNIEASSTSDSAEDGGVFTMLD